MVFVGIIILLLLSQLAALLAIIADHNCKNPDYYRTHTDSSSELKLPLSPPAPTEITCDIHVKLTINIQ